MSELDKQISATGTHRLTSVAIIALTIGFLLYIVAICGSFVDSYVGTLLSNLGGVIAFASCLLGLISGMIIRKHDRTIGLIVQTAALALLCIEMTFPAANFSLPGH